MSTRVVISNGIGLGTYSGNRFMDVAAIDAGKRPEPEKPIPSTTLRETGAQDFVSWGSNNRMPLEMVGKIETTGILNSIIDSQSRFALGEGVIWAYVKRDNTGKQTVEEIANIEEINDFMEENNHYFHELGWMLDQIGFKQGVARFMLSGDRKKIAAFQRDDITEMRYSKMNQEGDRKGKSDHIFLCAEWDRVSAVDDERVQKISLIDSSRPFTHLRELVDSSDADQFALTFTNPSWNKKYYPIASWYTADKWVQIAQKIPVMKDAMYLHNFRPRYMITIYPQFWTNRYNGTGEEGGKSWDDYTDEERERKRQGLYDEIDKHLFGAENHGKSIFTDGWIDQQTGKSYSEIEIKTIDDTVKQGDMLPDSAAANSEIAFSMKYNPGIIGASMPSGPYTNSQGGSNIREAVSVQIIMHEAERQNVRRIYNLIKKFNGWDKEYGKPGLNLEPIIPATILTTLDTGAGTKPVLLGADPNEKKSPITKPETP